MSRSGELTGVPTGFRDLDEITGGLQPGELMIIAARPSMGKTALALNIARNAAVDHRKKVAVFSLEMTKRSLVLRLLASEARVDFSSFRKGYGNADDYRSIQRAGEPARRTRRSGSTTSGTLTILEIKAKCRRLHVGARARPGDARLPPARARQHARRSARTSRSPRSATG